MGKKISLLGKEESRPAFFALRAAKREARRTSRGFLINFGFFYKNFVQKSKILILEKFWKFLKILKV